MEVRVWQVLKLKVECVSLCHSVYYEHSNRTWTYTWNSTSVKVAGKFDFYAVSKRNWQIYMLNTGILEHTAIVVPLNTDCNITEGGWCSLVSRETGLWPGKPGFGYQYEQRLSPVHHIQTSCGALPASNPMGTEGYFPGSKVAGAWNRAKLAPPHTCSQYCAKLSTTITLPAQQQL